MTVGHPEKKVNKDELKVTVESDPSQSALKLAFEFGDIKPTILDHNQPSTNESRTRPMKTKGNGALRLA